MRLIPLSIVALMSLGCSAIAVPATAAPVNGAVSRNLAPVPSAQDNFSQDNSSIVEVQYRRGSRRDWRSSRRGGRRGGGDDGAVAAGILGGLFLGAIIANQAQQQQQRSVEYCIRHYRSYDRYSGTYLGYDGRRHSCP